MENIYLIFIDQFFVFEGVKYLNHHFKFETWPVLSKFPILFSVVKLKLGHNVSQSSTDSELGLLNLRLRLHLPVLGNSETDLKLGFLNVLLARLLNFHQFMDEI